ncbi:MAG: 3-oxoacyl-ACP synthase [Blastocatellia bacterium]|nr:3-oxoacyl-ACP synthase [Blastocatellia bacterium]
MPDCQIVDIVSYMPERIIDNELFYPKDDKDDLANNPFFRGVKQRRFASPEYTSADLGTKALQKLLNRTETDPNSIDLIISTCIFSDTYWPGIGPALQHGVKAGNANILNIDTSCCSFLSGLNIAQAYIESGRYKKIVIVTVTNFISRLPEFQKSRRSSVLGDGATATLVVAGKPSILASYEKSLGQYYGNFKFEPDLVDGRFLNYWERGCGPITVNFVPEMVEEIRSNALELVPMVIRECLKIAKITPNDLALLFTHQPNRMFIDEWRKRVGVDSLHAHDTLEIYGNLFQSSIPVSFADALEKGKIRKDDLIAMGAFSMGGEFISAIAMRWI